MGEKYTSAERVGIGVAVLFGIPVVLLILLLLFLGLYWIALALDFVENELQCIFKFLPSVLKAFPNQMSKPLPFEAINL